MVDLDRPRETLDRDAPRLASHESVQRSVGGASDAQRELALEIVTTDDGLLDLRPDWEAMHAAVGAADGVAMNPFTSWGFTWAWWRARRGDRRVARPKLRLHVVVLRDAGQQVRAILPFVQARWGVGPLAFRALRIFGFGPSPADLRGPLVWPGWEAAVARSLASVWRRHEIDADLLIVDGLAENAPLTRRFEALARTHRWRWGPEVPNHVLPLPDDWATYRRAARGHLRKSLRHGYNSLKRDGHAWTFEMVTDPGAIDAAVKDVFRLHAARADPSLKPRHRDYYAHRVDRSTIRSVAAALTPQGRFGVARLWIKGRVVAARIVFIGSGAIYLHDAGADPGWSKYGVSTTLTSECLRWGMQRHARVAYLSTGVDPAKARWGGDQVALRRLYVAGGSVLGRVGPAIVWLRQSLRRVALVSAALAADALTTQSFP
jgi:hypothetical protein